MWTERATGISGLAPGLAAAPGRGTRMRANTGVVANPAALHRRATQPTGPSEGCGRRLHHPVHNHPPIAQKLSSVTPINMALGRVASPHTGVVGRRAPLHLGSGAFAEPSETATAPHARIRPGPPPSPRRAMGVRAWTVTGRGRARWRWQVGSARAAFVWPRLRPPSLACCVDAAVRETATAPAHVKPPPSAALAACRGGPGCTMPRPRTKQGQPRFHRHCGASTAPSPHAPPHTHTDQAQPHPTADKPTRRQTNPPTAHVNPASGAWATPPTHHQAG